MKNYAPSRARANIETVITVVPYLILLVISVKLAAAGSWLFALPAILASFFGVRVFTIFHDCGHQSFHPDKKWERNLGRVLGILCFTPFEAWTRNHSIHHRSLNNLDKILPGELITLTVKKFDALPKIKKFGYRLIRHPLFMLGIGGFAHFTLVMRVPRFFEARSRNSIRKTNIALALFLAAGCAYFGTKSFLLAQGVTLFLMTVMGTILFYVQHQFEESHFARDADWKFPRASVEGSSYFRFPLFLQWFSNNIGHHHLHHLRPKIPAYFLPKALEESPLPGKILGLRDIPACFRLNLFCEERGKLVSFREAYSPLMASETSTEEALSAGSIAAQKMRTELTPANTTTPHGSKWNPMNHPSDTVIPDVMSLMESGIEAR